LRFPKTADLGLFENVIATENFVGAFSGDNDLIAAVANEAGEKIQGSWRGAEDGLLGVPNDVWKDLRDLILGAANLLVVGVQEADGISLKGAFVEGVVVEGNGEGAKPGVRILLD
jgi:hypothetical protein